VIATVFGLVRSQQVRLPRLLALGALGLVGVVVGLAIGLGDTDDPLRAGAQLVNSFGLSLYAPVVTLVFASAALGEPVEDGTLSYLWLRPVARWQVVVGAWLATLVAAGPLVLVSLVLAAAATGAGGSLLVGTLASASLAVIAYSGVFGALGVLVRRPLVWGLAYILLWEGFVALAGAGAARLAVRSYTRSVLADVTGVELRLATVGPTTAVVVPVLVAVAGLALTTWRLRTMDVP
jgi:ABC-2 type transport system permease protein